MINQCVKCSFDFEITGEDIKVYDKLSPVFDGKKFSIPTPKLCPLCRQQRRLSFRNERKLYTRKCDLSGRQILSIYSPDKPYKVYDQPEWWSDKWDAMDYGRDYHSSRRFFEQFRELYMDVPRVSLHTIGVENSYYTCYTLFVKNCYLLFGASNSEDCMFGKYTPFNKNLVDALCVYSCEFCYEGVASDGCYNCRYFVNSRNCSDCTMIEDCSACKNCYCCFGLRQKEYCILNNFVGKEKYEAFVKDYEYLTHQNIEILRKKLKDLKDNLPHVQSHIYASENCSGDAIFNSKNCNWAFDIKDSEDCKYIYNSSRCVGSYDGVYTSPDGIQFSYNVCSTVGTNLMVTYFVWYCDNVRYSMDCLNSRDLFACVGLRNKRYCVFNKQYTKGEYEKLVVKIIEQMQKEGVWGEFFPYELAPCDYNETVAMEYFPLKKENALDLGARWQEEIVEKPEGEKSLPLDDIRTVDESILGKVLKCEISGKKYKILPQELKFYQRMKVPLPRRHPDQRHYDRLKLHDAHRLWERDCVKCGKKIMTIYPPDRGDNAHSASLRVCCEACYLKELY